MNNRVRTTVLGSAIFAICFFVSCAVLASDSLITPVNAWASSSQDPIFDPQVLINGSGLTGSGREATHSTDNAANLFWHSLISLPASGQWLEFDLGQRYDVTNALIWQLAFTGGADNGIKEYTISVAGSDHVFSLYDAGTLTLNIVTGLPNEPVQVVPLVANNVRYIKLNIQSNWGGVNGVGLSEVRFEGLPSDVLTIAPVSATVSTSYSYENDHYLGQYMIDGSGLTGSGRTATHTNANEVGLFWHSDLPIDVDYQWIEFDLGAPYDVVNALIWQLAQNVAISRGIQEFTIRVAGPDHIFETHSANNRLSLATGLPNEPVQVVPLLAKNIQFIRFNIQSNWGAPGIVGLSEVHFEVAIPPTPDSILVPIAASASSSYDYRNSFTPQWLINGAALTGTGRAATHLAADGQGLFWHSAIGSIAGEWVEFDLGTTCNVTNALIWQLGQSPWMDRGVKDFTIDVAGADHIFSSYSTGNQLAIATGAPQVPVQVVPLVANNIRYVRLNILSNWGNGIVVGLSEVRFEGAPTEPHPSDPIIAPIDAMVSTMHTYEDDQYLAQYMIDGSGLSGIGQLATHTDESALKLFWHSAVGIDVSQQWAEFDLGMPYDVANALIWQLAQKGWTTRGVYEFTIKVAGSDHIFSTYSIKNWLNQAHLADEPVQVVPLEAKGIRYVRFEIQSNWGADGIVGLSEVRFAVHNEVAPVNTNSTSTRTPVTVAASSHNNGNLPSHMINGSGLTGTGAAATHANGAAENSMWLSDGGAITNQWLEFDLGMELHLVATALWQYNQTTRANGQPYDFTGRGIQAMTIYTAGENKNYTEYGGARLSGATGFATEPVQLVPLAKEHVRYVKFAINSNWGYDNYVGLSEVKFLFKNVGTLIQIK